MDPTAPLSPDEPRFVTFLRAAGAHIEEDCRAHGAPLPDGITGEQLGGLLFSETWQELLRASSEGRPILFDMDLGHLIAETEAELEGGRTNPAFADEILRKIKDRFAQRRLRQ